MKTQIVCVLICAGIFAGCAPGKHYPTNSNNSSNLPTPAPGPSPTPTTATFKAVQGILLPKCGGCHGANVATAGIRFNTYAGVLATVTAGSSNTSRLYSVTSSGAMPPQPAPRLNANEILTLRLWIDLGALNN